MRQSDHKPDNYIGVVLKGPSLDFAFPFYIFSFDLVYF